MALAISPIKTPANSKIIHPKFSPKSFENILSIGTGHGEQLMRAGRKGFARSRSDMHLPNRLGNKNKHIYAKNILNVNQPPTKSLGKRVTDVTKGGTNDSVDQLFYSSQSSPSLHHPIQQQQPQINDGKGKFAYSSDKYYNKNHFKRKDSFQKSCLHNIASREPSRAFFKYDYATSKHNNMAKRGLRNFDKLGFGESYVSKYDRKYELTCQDVIFMKNVDRSSDYPKKKRWDPNEEGKKFYLPSNDVLQTDAYAGKMWMMGGQGNKLSRSDGIDMSLGLITTPNDLKNLKVKRQTLMPTRKR